MKSITRQQQQHQNRSSTIDGNIQQSPSDQQILVIRIVIAILALSVIVLLGICIWKAHCPEVNRNDNKQTQKHKDKHKLDASKLDTDIILDTEQDTVNNSSDMLTTKPASDSRSYHTGFDDVNDGHDEQLHNTEHHTEQEEMGTANDAQYDAHYDHNDDDDDGDAKESHGALQGFQSSTTAATTTKTKTKHHTESVARGLLRRMGYLVRRPYDRLRSSLFKPKENASTGTSTKQNRHQNILVPPIRNQNNKNNDNNTKLNSHPRFFAVDQSRKLYIVDNPLLSKGSTVVGKVSMQATKIVIDQGENESAIIIDKQGNVDPISLKNGRRDTSRSGGCCMRDVAYTADGVMYGIGLKGTDMWTFDNKKQDFVQLPSLKHEMLSFDISSQGIVHAIGVDGRLYQQHNVTDLHTTDKEWNVLSTDKIVANLCCVRIDHCSGRLYATERNGHLWSFGSVWMRHGSLPGLTFAIQCHDNTSNHQ